MTQPLWPINLVEKIVLMKEPALRASAYRRAAKHGLLAEADELCRDAIVQLVQMLKCGLPPFGLQPGTKSSDLLDAYQRAAEQADKTEVARLESELLRWADRAVCSSFLITAALRKASRQQRHTRAMRAQIADDLKLPAEHSAEECDARARLKQMLGALKKSDQIALIAFRFRRDEAERLTLCENYDKSLLPAVENAVALAAAGGRDLATLKKRYQRAVQRARDNES